MTPEQVVLTPEERDEIALTAGVRQWPAEQFENLEQQHEVASLGMWVFLATEVMFFGALFLGLGVYRFMYPEAFARASEKLNWIIGGVNTVVLLISSLTIVLAVHAARVGRRNRLIRFLIFTAMLGTLFLALKGLEYYIDYRDNLIPGWRFDEDEWVYKEGLRPDQVPQVKLFLLFYWIMTATHALHVTIGIGAVIAMAVLAWRGRFSTVYYSPVDVTALYWHFVDVVWIFLLPMLYLLGTQTAKDFHF